MFLWEVTFKQLPQWSAGASYTGRWEETDIGTSMQNSHGRETGDIQERQGCWRCWSCNRKGWAVGDRVGAVARARYRLWILSKREGGHWRIWEEDGHDLNYKKLLWGNYAQGPGGDIETSSGGSLLQRSRWERRVAYTTVWCHRL